jgi:hypothetical protein
VQPSWEQREAQQNAEDEARLEYLGQMESLREDWAEYEGDIPGMLDGRPGVDPVYRPAVYMWVILAAGVVLLVLFTYLFHGMPRH